VIRTFEQVALCTIVAITIAGCRAPAEPGAVAPTSVPTTTQPSAAPTDDPLGGVDCEKLDLPGPAQPAGNGARPAVPATLELFQSTPIVGFGEYHGWPALHEFFGQLICDPTFPEAVDSIVVEFANSRLQDVLDRYIAGEPVARDEIAAVWRETTQTSGVWESPIYGSFLSLVRTVNQSLPLGQRIRVLAGDPPVDMAEVTEFGECNSEAPTCLDYWIYRRDESFADVVESEVLARGGTALLIAGVGHMTHQLDPEIPVLNIPDLLEAERPGVIFTVIPHRGFEVSEPDPDLADNFGSWPVPGLAMLGESWPGELDACVVEGAVSPDAECPDGVGPTLADLADGYLYLGDP
jgi:hypothetical protein